jgi:AraC-like DNA-binding protein
MLGHRSIHEDVLRRVVRARQRIREEFAEAMRIDALARDACLSDKQFRRVFAQVYGETPGQYLVRVRMREAKELLARGTPVTDTCLRVGYGSLGTFSTRFTGATGRSPRAFQKELRAFGTVPARLRALYVPMCFLSGPPGLNADPVP